MTNQSWEQTGFIPASALAKPRIIAAVAGLEKTGKNHFAFTAPGPIALLSLDFGDEGMIEKFIDGTVASKTIWSKSYKIPSGRRDVNKMIEDATPIWEEVKKDFMYALSNARTVIVDTETEQWELIRLARLGKLEQIKPHHYGPVNREYKEVFVKAAYESNANVIFLQRLKRRYINDKATSDFDQAGYSGVPYDVQVNCRTYIDEHSQFALYVDNCRQNGLMRGTVLTGEMLNFQMLAMMVLPSVDPTAWL